MLLTFEGQDGAGKTALLMAVYEELRRQRIPAMAVPEFSDSPIGHRLVEALGQDKFLRPVPGDDATVLTRALDVVADLYYFDEQVIDPALHSGLVVLKDRHLDTVLSTQTPRLMGTGRFADECRALQWLAALLGKLRHRPTVTVHVDAPLAVRRERLAARKQTVAEEVSAGDLAVFAAREQVMQRLIAAEPRRFRTVHTGHHSLEEAARDVLALVHARQASRI